MFDGNSFAMCKTKALVVLETIDCDMLDIVNNGPHSPMYLSMINKAPTVGLKQNPKASYDEEDKRLNSLDVKARDAIRNSLP